MSIRYCWLMVLFSSSIFCDFLLYLFYQLKREGYVVFKYNWIGLLLLSVLTVFASHILQLCCLVQSHIGLCILGKLILFSLYNNLFCIC